MLQDRLYRNHGGTKNNVQGTICKFRIWVQVQYPTVELRYDPSAAKDNNVFLLDSWPRESVIKQHDVNSLLVNK